MAFTASSLYQIGYSGGGPLYMYTTADTIAAGGTNITDAGYFNAAAGQLPVGTVIIAVCNTGATRTIDLCVVSANTGTAVTIVNGT